MVEFLRNWTKSVEIWQYCHYTGNRGPGFSGSRWVNLGIIGSDDGYICIDKLIKYDNPPTP